MPIEISCIQPRFRFYILKVYHVSNCAFEFNALSRRPWDFRSVEARKRSKNKSSSNLLRQAAMPFCLLFHLSRKLIHSMILRNEWLEKIFKTRFNWNFLFEFSFCDVRPGNAYLSFENYEESQGRSAAFFPALTHRVNATRLTHCADNSYWHFVTVTTARIFSVTRGHGAGENGIASSRFAWYRSSLATQLTAS